MTVLEVIRDTQHILLVKECQSVVVFRLDVKKIKITISSREGLYSHCFCPITMQLRFWVTQL